MQQAVHEQADTARKIERDQAGDRRQQARELYTGLSKAELAEELAERGRMRVLDQLGLADQVVEQGCVLRTWEMGHADGRIMTRFPLRFEQDYGYPMLVGIRRELLLDTLHTAAVNAGVDLRFGHQVTGIEQRTHGRGEDRFRRRQQ